MGREVEEVDEWYGACWWNVGENKRKLLVWRRDDKRKMLKKGLESQGETKVSEEFSREKTRANCHFSTDNEVILYLQIE
jgi:hypothetical protein